MYARMVLRRYLATVRRMREDEPLDYAAEITAPCLVLRSHYDAVVPNAVARELAAKLPKGHFTRVPNAAHALQFDKPIAFTDLALAFSR